MVEVPPQTLYKVVVEGKTWGGSYDSLSAVTIACTVAQLFVAATGSGSDLPLVLVEDDKGAAIAFLGGDVNP